jgi:lysophospholipid acyltransferase (LPLAT)-like uncharacterized protein
MVAKPGPVQLAQLCHAKWIGCYHATPSHYWELNSWDRFMIPKPFSRVTFGWPLHVPPDLTLVQQALDEAVRLSQQV